jgi:type IV pilus assembly protein PilA
MVVVSIIGVLAAIAIPNFLRNAKKAKTSEAITNVKKMYDGSRDYIFEEAVTRHSGIALATQFPEPEAVTPAGTCCSFPGGKCAPNPSDFITQTWTALKFSVDDPHYYRYEYDSTGSPGAGVGSAFTARALGDLDCDGTYSTFEMGGVWSSTDNSVNGQGGLHIENDVE